jgi:hypothetical protein
LKKGEGRGWGGDGVDKRRNISGPTRDGARKIHRLIDRALPAVETGEKS